MTIANSIQQIHAIALLHPLPRSTPSLVNDRETTSEFCESTIEFSVAPVRLMALSAEAVERSAWTLRKIESAIV